MGRKERVPKKVSVLVSHHVSCLTITYLIWPNGADNQHLLEWQQLLLPSTWQWFTVRILTLKPSTERSSIRPDGGIKALESRELR